MQVIINTPLNSFTLKPGDIVLTSNQTLLVSTINVNDYRIALIDLAKAEVVELKQNIDAVTHVNDSMIIKVISNKEAQLTLP